MKRSIPLRVLCLIVPVLAASGLALGQSTTTVVYPQDNVTGGALANRRPGQLIDDAISAHATRMDSVLYDHGGANPQEATKTDRHTLLLTTLLESIFNSLRQLANVLLLAAQVSGATTTTSS